jgi:hypothetical protein
MYLANLPLRLLAIIWASPYTVLGLLIGIVGVCTGATDAAVAQQLVNDMLAKLRATIGMVNFWNKPADVADLRGELSDLLLFSNIDAIADKSDRLVTEIVALAKTRQRDILA